MKKRDFRVVLILTEAPLVSRPSPETEGSDFWAKHLKAEEDHREPLMWGKHELRWLMVKLRVVPPEKEELPRDSFDDKNDLEN